MKKISYYIFTSILLLFSVSAKATLENVKSKLATAGCQEMPGEKYGISLQFNTLLEPGIVDGLFTIVKKEQTTYQCAGSKVGVIVIDYPDATNAKSALSFLEGFIWGPQGRSAMHPERIYQQDNSIVLLSSAQTSVLDNAFANTPPSLSKAVSDLYTLLKCPAGVKEACTTLNEFQNASMPQTLKPAYFTLAQGITLNGKGEILSKPFMAFMSDNKAGVPKLDVYDIYPENQDEIKFTTGYIASLKEGKRDTQNPLHQFMAGDVGKRPLMTTSVSDNMIMFKFSETKTGVLYTGGVRENKGFYHAVMRGELKNGEVNIILVTFPIVP
ncbi:hypothetical protein K1X76_01425 [bacterium]|nr:hypothetical protein [bacterium]